MHSPEHHTSDFVPVNIFSYTIIGQFTDGAWCGTATV